jgi:hypothetical protein
MSLSAVQLLWAHIYRAFPAKATFLSALALFEVGCLVSATAKNSNAVIVGRAIAGMGVAGVFSGGLMSVSPINPRGIWGIANPSSRQNNHIYRGSATTTAYECSVWHSYWSYPGSWAGRCWGFHIRSELEMVLLDQPSYRRGK